MYVVREKHTKFVENNIWLSALAGAHRAQWMASHEEFKCYFPYKFTIKVRKEAS